MKYMKQVHQHKRYVTEPPTLLDRIVAINSTGRCQRVGSGGLFLFVQMLDGTESPAGVEHAAACRVLFAPEAHTAAGRDACDRMRPDATGCDRMRPDAAVLTAGPGPRRWPPGSRS